MTSPAHQPAEIGVTVRVSDTRGRQEPSYYEVMTDDPELADMWTRNHHSALSGLPDWWIKVEIIGGLGMPGIELS